MYFGAWLNESTSNDELARPSYDIAAIFGGSITRRTATANDLRV